MWRFGVHILITYSDEDRPHARIDITTSADLCSSSKPALFDVHAHYLAARPKNFNRKTSM